jgi:peptidoglycan/LPS O-acetylase OafA/YrhL
MQKIEPSPKYRADVDGLRAIAILLVVGFHAFPQSIAAGFIGVDVFFVISGFLISTTIITEFEHNNFNLLNFYGRRIRRIFPSLILVIILCFLFGWITLLPDEFKELSKHILAGATFTSNFVLWNESSYFDNAAETKILLHLWSLAIEEQFYIFWPGLICLFWKTRFNLLYVIVTLITVSFGANIVGSHTDQIGMFYSPASRFWELLTGSALALILINRHNQVLQTNKKNKFVSLKKQYIYENNSFKKLLPQISSTLGVLLFSIPMLSINKTTVYPGWWALFPVLATVLVITAGPTAWVNKLLSNNVLVSIGLISYPLYLWHWPILSFANIINGKSPDVFFKLIAILLSILLAWLSYKFIEKPIRHLNTKSKKSIPLILLGMIVFIGALGLLTYKDDGFLIRSAANPYSQLTGDIGRDAYLNFIVTNFSPCKNDKLRSLSVNDTKYGHRCFQSQSSSDINILLIGDSHAEHLLPGLAKELKSINIGSFIQPGLPVETNELFAQAFDLIKNDKKIHTVIFSAFWMDKIPTNDLKIKDDFVSTINTLKAANKKIIIMGDVPNFGVDPKNCKYQRIFSFDDTRCHVSVKQSRENRKTSSKTISNVLAELKDIQYIDTDLYFCNESTCSMTNEDKILFRDAHHLNIEGSLYLGKKIYGKIN